MEKLNKYESPEIVILELENEDLITTSIGDTPVVDWD